VNLWTVGCADPRLTAQAGPLWTSRGRRSHLAHRSAAAHKLHSTPQQDRMNLISGNRETSSRLPALAYSPRKLSKRPAPSQSASARSVKLVRAVEGQGAGTCQSNLLLLCGNDFEVGIVLEGYCLLHSKIVGHCLKQASGLRFIGASDRHASPFLPPRLPKRLPTSLRFFIRGSRFVAPAV
jgi:hypothetical protein